jgi:uncharacterized protein (TIGR02145 family)
MELKIGKNVWTAANLSAVQFLNGDKITIAKSKREWKKLCDEKKPACAFSKFKDKPTKDGAYYNVFAVFDSRGLIPEGWRLPTTKDWASLARAVGGKKNAGEALKAPKGWKNYKSEEPGSSKFAALPSGEIDTSSEEPDFSMIGSMAYWWTTDVDSGEILATYVSEYTAELHIKPIIHDDMHNSDYAGFNVRCVK